MNKPIVILLVLAFSMPAAAGTVTITVVDVGGGCGGPAEAEIRYAADANVRAFALDVTVDAGAITEISNYFVGECNAVNKGYGIFPGTIDIDDTGEVNDWGTPIADKADLPSDTKPGLGKLGGVTIEMGALYTAGNRPSRTGWLCRLTVSTTCHMTVTGNTGRGKVIMEDGTQATLNLAGATNVPIAGYYCLQVPNIVGLLEYIGEPIILAAGFIIGTETCEWNNNAADCEILDQDPNAGEWRPPGFAVALHKARNWSYPPGWDSLTQCHADVDANSFINTADFPAFRDSFYCSYGQGCYNPDADYNRDGIVNTSDFPQFRDNFYLPVDSNCMQGDINHVYKPGAPPTCAGC